MDERFRIGVTVAVLDSIATLSSVLVVELDASIKTMELPIMTNNLFYNYFEKMEGWGYGQLSLYLTFDKQ